MKSFEALEEIAKFEQRNSLKRGKFLTLFNTYAVKSLGRSERMEFFNYLRAKKAKNIFLILAAAASLACIFIFNFGITGGSIFEVENEAGWISWALIAVFVISFLLLIYEKAGEHALKKRFRKHIKLAEKAIR